MRFTPLVLLFLAVPALAFELGIERDTFVAPLGSARQLEVNITSDINDTYHITVIGEKPWMVLEATSFKVGAGETKPARIFLSPGQNVLTGLYHIRVVVQSLDTDDIKQKDLYLSVTKEDGINVEAVFVTGTLVPLGTAEVRTNVKNYGKSTVHDVTLSIRLTLNGAAIAEAEESIASIGPSETAVNEKSFPLAPYAAVGEYTAEVTMSYLGESSYTRQRFLVAEKPVIEKKEDIQPYLTGRNARITLKNYGNVAQPAIVAQELTEFERMFFSGDIPTYVTEKFYVWEVTLKPAEERGISYRVDYAPLIVFMAMIAILAALTFFRVKSVSVNKYLLQKKFIQEGEEFTVGIDIQNNSGSKIDDIEVRDFVPPAFTVKDAEGLKPRKKKSATGTELSWALSGLHNGEERVLSYKIIPLVGVGGTIRLPSASAHYRHLKVNRENYSRSPSIGVEIKKKFLRKGD